MSTISYGSTPKTNSQFIEELHTLIGTEFPLTIAAVNGEVVAMSFDTTWKEGTTVPNYATTGDEDEPINVYYKEAYTEQSLTEQQIATLEDWASKNVKTN